VQNACDVLFHQAQEKSISLIIDSTDECWVMSNGEMLERVVLNLVGNAIKYSPRDTQVSLTIKKFDESMLQISIIDQGTGIPNDLATNLFKSYSRGSDSNTQKEQGVGLGLRFVDIALKRLNSQIQFESSAKGTRFYFNIESIDL
jgi:signal transduction histidine kinase